MTAAIVALTIATPLASFAQVTPGPGRGTASARAAADRALERERLDAVARQPNSFDAQHALGELYLHRGKLDAAIPHLERARELDPRHYANGYDLAVAYLESGRADAARTQATWMLAVEDTGELHNLLGDIAAGGGDYTTAAAEYQRAAHLAPTEEHLFDWGDNLLRLRAFEPAIEVFVAAIRRHPKSARLQIGLGIAYYSRGQYDEAVTAFCTAADLTPGDPRPYQFLGEMYGVSPERSADVTRRLARFVKRQPSNALGHFYYAMNLWKGQPTAAPPASLTLVESHLRRAMALEPTLAKAFVQLGILLSEQRRWPAAVQALETAIRLEPDVAQAHFRLAQAYQRTGQETRATEELAIFERLKARESTPPEPE
jgi:tetratricopeptide (TPR) repeat protein